MKVKEHSLREPMNDNLWAHGLIWWLFLEKNYTGTEFWHAVRALRCLREYFGGVLGREAKFLVFLDTLTYLGKIF